MPEIRLSIEIMEWQKKNYIKIAITNQILEIKWFASNELLELVLVRCLDYFKAFDKILYNQLIQLLNE